MGEIILSLFKYLHFALFAALSLFQNQRVPRLKLYSLLLEIINITKMYFCSFSQIEGIII